MECLSRVFNVLYPSTTLDFFLFYFLLHIIYEQLFNNNNKERERERESLQKAKKMKTYKDLEKIDMNKLAKP